MRQKNRKKERKRWRERERNNKIKASNESWPEKKLIPGNHTACKQTEC